MEDMNQSEVLVEETEQKMLYKILLMIEDEKKSQGSLETLEEKVRTLTK